MKKEQTAGTAFGHQHAEHCDEKSFNSSVDFETSKVPLIGDPKDCEITKSN